MVSAVARAAGDEREIKVWDADTGALLTTITCDPFSRVRAYGAVALSPQGEFLAHDEYALGQEGEMAARVCVREMATGGVVRTFDGFSSLIEKLAFSSDGRYLAIARDGWGVVVYDCGTGQMLHEQPLNGSTAETCWDLAFSPDGRRLAAATRVQVLVWDVATGQKAIALRGGPPRSGDNGFNARVAWSPDGRRLAANNWNHSVSIWDAGDRHTQAAKQALHQAAEERVVPTSP
jgi:WD40 repeat protein